MTQKYVNVNRPHTAFVSTLRALAARTAVPDKSLPWFCPCWPMPLNLGHMVLSALSPASLSLCVIILPLNWVWLLVQLPCLQTLPHWLYPAALGRKACFTLVAVIMNCGIINLGVTSELSAPVSHLTNKLGDRVVQTVSIYASCPDVIINSLCLAIKCVLLWMAKNMVSLQMRVVAQGRPGPAPGYPEVIYIYNYATVVPFLL